MLQKISDHDLKEAAEQFQMNSNLENFTNIVGLWVMDNARIRYKLDEDDLSELFITFHQKAKSCIEFYLRKDYTDFTGFMSVYTKHLVLNIFRKRRQAYSEEYLQLWQEERINKNTEELIHQSSSYKIQKSLKEVSSLGRIIISLRFNIPMKENDLRILYKYLKKQNKPTLNFHKEYETRVMERSKKRETLLLNLNNCNRKIYNSLDSYPVIIKRRKRKILHNLINTHIIYSLKEMSELLSLSRHQTGRLYRNSLEIIKERLRLDENSIQAA
ncbi:MAG: hypothetical protein KBA66_09375 [Leptospiraceae bacterium]|nr:hypothetical protein [Leptospiraceae bacterium]